MRGIVELIKRIYTLQILCPDAVIYYNDEQTHHIHIHAHYL